VFRIDYTTSQLRKDYYSQTNDNPLEDYGQLKYTIIATKTIAKVKGAS
jgi:hypothetical protein